MTKVIRVNKDHKVLKVLKEIKVFRVKLEQEAKLEKLVLKDHKAT